MQDVLEFLKECGEELGILRIQGKRAEGMKEISEQVAGPLFQH